MAGQNRRAEQARAQLALFRPDTLGYGGGSHGRFRSEQGRGPVVDQPRKFCLVLIKPSHYDDDGYVIQWYRSAIPSNSLAALYGLALDCKQRHILGDDVELQIEAIDETNDRVRPEELAKLIEKAGSGVVMMVGVQ